MKRPHIIVATALLLILAYALYVAIDRTRPIPDLEPKAAQALLEACRNDAAACVNLCVSSAETKRVSDIAIEMPGKQSGTGCIKPKGAPSKTGAGIVTSFDNSCARDVVILRDAYVMIDGIDVGATPCDALAAPAGAAISILCPAGANCTLRGAVAGERRGFMFKNLGATAP